MGYKKYSPFLKSIKVLILLSFVYFTTRLDATNPRIPVTLKNFNYHDLPVYCKPSTGHFECKNNNGRTYCLPESMKCKIKCYNDAELNCPHSATSCKFGQFMCSNSNNSNYLVCLPDSLLCDGSSHCNNAEDELPDMCDNRVCSSGQFACRSPGHCIDESKRCDGKYDCMRTGLNDKSDEQDCPKPQAVNCTAGQFRCRDGSACIDQSRYCDSYKDCHDGSDEPSTCQPECPTGQFLCDGRCAKNSLRCDGSIDCQDGLDEAHCNYDQCTYDSDIYCKHSKSCVSQLSSCDGFKDCSSGEDEVCKVSYKICAAKDYWTCKSGSHCIHSTSRCDGIIHCPDGSDERNCPTKEPPTTPQPPACPSGRHLCNGTAAVCVSLADVCNGRDKCPQPDSAVDRACRLLAASQNPCHVNNGNCQHDCVATVTGSRVVPECRCRHGYQLTENGHCEDVNECSVYGKCSQLCENTIGSYECSCRPGYGRHGNRCHAHGAAKILLSTANSIDFVDTDTMLKTRVVSGLASPKYLSYDRMQRRVFFHTRNGDVGSVGLDGSDLRILQRNLVLDAIAYDWSRRLLFYTVPQDRSGQPGHVGVMDVGTGRRTRLLSLDCPRGLTVHPSLGLLFVSLWCGRPGLYSLRLDGTQLRILTDDVGLPGHLALDTAASPQRIFWIDHQRRGVFSATLDGSDRREHYRTIDRPSVLFSLQVFGDRLYWNNFTAGTVDSVDKFNGSDYKRVGNSQKKVVSVSVYHSLLQPHVELGSCDCRQHICIPGIDLNSKATCLCDQSFTRDPVTGMCVNGTEPENELINQQQQQNLNFLNNRGGAQRQQRPADDADKDAEINPDEQLLHSSVGVIAGVVISALAICVLAGAGVACLCLRHQDTQSMHLHHDSLFQKHRARSRAMPKVDSRTPLTDCEIDMDNAGQLSSNSSSSSRF